jgi:hypothetical protein
VTPRSTLICLLAVGCGTAASKPIVEFPSTAALQAIEARPAQPVTMKTADLPAVNWTIAGADTAHTLFEPWAPTTEGERVMAELLAQRGKPPRLTRAMSCVARELARLFAETEAPPPDSLRAFILGACGTIARDVGVVPMSGPAPPGVADGALLAAWRASLGKALMENVPADASEVGLWFGHIKDKVIAVAAYDHLAADVQPFSLIPAGGGELVVEGQIRGPVEYVEGYINHGRFSADACFSDPTVPRPRFRVICHMADEDPTALVELVYAEPRRVLAHAFAQFLARRDPAAELAHRPEPYGAPHPVTGNDDFTRTVIDQLNEVRRTAQLPPLRLAPVQSITAGKLAGHYFAAVTAGKDVEVQETIALGMMAGWEVSGMIRDASFVSELVPHTHDAGRWLTEVLTTPTGRTALLDEHIEELALGPTLLSNPDGLAAVVAGYRFHHGNDHAHDVNRLFFRVAAARKRMSLNAPARLAQIEPALNAELARVHQGQQQPADALQAVLEAGVTQFGQGMRGYLVEATSLNALEIPKEILEQPTLHLTIGVTHFKPEGAAWAQLVILVVFVDYAGGT